MDLLQDMAGSTAAAAARALDHRRQKAQNLPWSKNVETFTKLNLTDFSLYPSPQEFDEARPLVNYKSTNAQISAFSTERERVPVVLLESL
jgi:hypothetical protein